MIGFRRSHGLGNDYLVLDGRDGAFDPTPARIQLLCDRHRGPGGDGVLLHVEATRADHAVRIFNPDGEEAEKSGNGLRIFAHTLWETGAETRPTFTIETFSGAHLATARVWADRRPLEITVDMGRPSFVPAEVPCRLPGPEAVEVPIEVGGQTLKVTAVSVGNPHCVLFLDTLDGAPIATLGPLMERHPAFPNRTNVQLAQVIDRGRLSILIWERGAGLTQASGSSACAAAAAGHRLGLLDRHITVDMPGGSLIVELSEDGHITQRGPVEGICEGALSADLRRALGLR